ncbi:glycosyltransferase family 4 protein [uncultured Cohaesibacter sp.]|uniref:glycosyltransferase family 4 protein n=1 Tax=uncultured Cohaesibacter sp. TaxID=1002546 RepID=UPI0029314D53|nr:glycosyltransferase family 4 protein [uncultured Cohaesibacter sp.]
MKTIWIINQYASTPETGYGGRFHYLSKALAKRGYQVVVIGEQHHHLLNSNLPRPLPETETCEGYQLVRIPLLNYDHAHSKKRVLNWILFDRKLGKLYPTISPKPDVILYSSPSLLPFSGACKLARRTGARLVFDVRDIWPLTLMELGGISRINPIIQWMLHVEKKAYRLSDAVTSSMPNAIEHFVMNGLDPHKFTWIPNGVDVEEWEKAEPLSDKIDRQIPRGMFTIGYAGSLGTANAIGTIKEAASKLATHDDILFIFAGERDPAKTGRDGNILTLPFLPKRQIPTLLSRFDASVISWHDSPLYRFGISANKVPEYLLAGKPILNCYSGRADLVEGFNAGMTVPAGNSDALAEAILAMKALSEQERREMGENGRHSAVTQLSYETLAEKLEDVLFPDQNTKI